MPPLRGFFNDKTGKKQRPPHLTETSLHFFASIAHFFLQAAAHGFHRVDADHMLNAAGVLLGGLGVQPKDHFQILGDERMALVDVLRLFDALFRNAGTDDLRGSNPVWSQILAVFRYVASVFPVL